MQLNVEKYKMTEVGLVPIDWKVMKFTDCAELKHGFQFREEHFSKDGVKVTKIGSLVDGGGLDFRDATYIPTENLKQFSRFTLDKGDVLMALTGATLGKVSKVDTDEITLQNYRVGNFLNKENSTKEYIYCLLQSHFIQKKIKTLVNEAAQPNLGKGDFDKFIVPLPATKGEQIAIATALCDADVLIERLEKLIAKKKAIKQGATQQLLTSQKRLPGFIGRWEVKCLGDVADVVKGAGLSKASLSASGTRQCILYGELFTTYEFVIRRIVSKTNALGGTLSQSGDVLMPGSTTTEGIDLATASALFVDGVALGGDINIIRKKGEGCYDSIFLANYLTHVKKIEIAERAQGITIIHLYGRHLLDLSMELPTRVEQTAIAEVLSDMDAEIAALEQRRDKTRALKQGMMQELLTGRIRLV